MCGAQHLDHVHLNNPRLRLPFPYILILYNILFQFSNPFSKPNLKPQTIKNPHPQYFKKNPALDRISLIASSALPISFFSCSQYFLLLFGIPSLLFLLCGEELICVKIKVVERVNDLVCAVSFRRLE